MNRYDGVEEKPEHHKAKEERSHIGKAKKRRKGSKH